MSKIYNFSIPVSGYEDFSIKAESFEEALDKINNNDYHIEPVLNDVDWDFGLGQTAADYLPSAYTISKE